MVGGTIYFRGPIKEYSERDVKLLELTPQDWEWLSTNMKPYLEAIDRMSYYEELTRSPDEWKKLIAYTPQEKRTRKWFKIRAFRLQEERHGKKRWDRAAYSGRIWTMILPFFLTLPPAKTDATNLSGRMKNICRPAHIIAPHTSRLIKERLS